MSRTLKVENLKLSGVLSVLCILYSVFFASCNPVAKWETENVEIEMKIETVSAGFVECSFSTNKDAYYLIAIEEAKEDMDPTLHPKQFMMLALDSANVEYLAWRNKLLKEGEFNVAPFSSHALQYGTINHFFTGLWPDTEYWIYAFVVNPDKMEPAGKLYFTTVKTTEKSIVDDIHFHYRVKGYWDYVYPLDGKNNVYNRFPYVATMRDSAELVERGIMEEDVVLYFMSWMLNLFVFPEQADVLYGVKAVENNGMDSYLLFEEDHTYYTAIGGYDGSFKQMAVFKFHWQGDSTEYYFVDTDSTANMVLGNPDWESYQ